MAIELIKELDPKKVEAWDRIHDKRKLYRCERCGSEWKCEYGENKLRSVGMNEDPDILCQRCGFPTVKEVTLNGTENAPKLSDVFPNPFSPGLSNDVEYFCCGINAHLFTEMYHRYTKGSLWFEDKKAGELEEINESVIECHVVRLVFALERKFNWLWDRKLGDFNFKIEFNNECDEIRLRLWKKE